MSIREDNRLIALYQKFQTKTASADELEEFYDFLASDGAEQRLFELLETDFQLTERQRSEISEVRAEQIFQNITSHPQPSGKIKNLWLRIAGAAAIAGILAGSIFFKDQLVSADKNSGAISATQDIVPGKNTATLILANGRKIMLSTVPYGQLANESGVNISKSATDEIVYDIKDRGITAPGEQNMLSTAMGETYRVKLPDGSLVWLNAASSLKYPVSFSSSKDRRVELDGEAYFEIAKDKVHPFVVKTDGQEVTVLGTHFNIKAYKEDKGIVTTLAEGSVRVDYQTSTWSDHGKMVYKDDVVLTPGQQSLLKGESISLSKANLEESLAWKDGNFIFNEENIEKIMQDVARWYNIEVLYEGTMPTGAFSGNISRSKNISQVLKALEATKLVHFRIDGRRVYVSK